MLLDESVFLEFQAAGKLDTFLKQVPNHHSPASARTSHHYSAAAHAPAHAPASARVRVRGPRTTHALLAPTKKSDDVEAHATGRVTKPYKERDSVSVANDRRPWMVISSDQLGLAASLQMSALVGWEGASTWLLQQ